MNGKYIATRSVQLAQMLVGLGKNYGSEDPSFTPEEKAAIKGAAAQISAISAADTDATAYGTACKSVFTAMVNKLDELGGTA